jgi:hypothetical protein
VGFGALGSFNPKFYGVSLVHADPGDLADLAAYDEADDLGAWIESASVDIEAVGRRSAIDHEVRHFHDFLLSPFGLNTMGLRIQATVNGLQTIAAIRESSGKYLPVPLSRWMSWDQQRRQAWIDRDGRHWGYDDLADFVQMPGPEHRDAIETEGLESLEGLPLAVQIGRWAGATAGAFGALLKMREPLPPRDGYPMIAPNDAFEGSAHLIQAQAVWNGQGEAAGTAYLDFLETSGLTSLRPYNALRLALEEAIERVPAKRLAELYVWTLLTHPTDVGTFGNPAIRLLLLLAFARSAPRALLLEQPTEALWDGLDLVTRSPPWRRNLAEADAIAARRADKYRALRQARGGPEADSLFEICDLWLADRQRMSAFLTDDPGAYADPSRYVDLPIGSLPLPYLQISFGRFAHKRDARLPDEARLKAIFADQEEMEAIAYFGLIGSGPRLAQLDRVIDAALVGATVDFCFFDEPGSSALDNYLEVGLKELSGKKPVFVY